MKYLKIVMVLSGVLLSCNGSENKNSGLSQGSNNNNQLKKEIIFNNNKESYGIFLDISANDSLNYEALALSLVLAGRGDAKAKHMVFYYMINIFDRNKFDLNNLSKLSEVNRNFALHYLMEAAEMNEFSSQIYLEEIYRFGIGIEKNVAKADSIIKDIKKEDATYKPLYELKNDGE
jgi:hypothetical protein